MNNTQNYLLDLLHITHKLLTQINIDIYGSVIINCYCKLNSAIKYHCFVLHSYCLHLRLTRTVLTI